MDDPCCILKYDLTLNLFIFGLDHKTQESRKNFVGMKKRYFRMPKLLSYLF